MAQLHYTGRLSEPREIDRAKLNKLVAKISASNLTEMFLLVIKQHQVSRDRIVYTIK